MPPRRLAAILAPSLALALALLVTAPHPAAPPPEAAFVAAPDASVAEAGMRERVAMAAFLRTPEPSRSAAPTRPARAATRPARGAGAARGTPEELGAVARFYFELLSCTRAGGWVEADGSCTPGVGDPLPPLVLDAGIGRAVAAPYARRLSELGVCDHFVGGTPDGRLRAAGFRSPHWGENLGCRDVADPYASVLGSHRFFQDERAANGGHWRNMMDPGFRRVGIAVARSGRAIRLVIDFYRP